jgi:hypothetical protein
VIALRVAVFSWAAVWCNARRSNDAAVVGTLEPILDHLEFHAVLAVMDQQLTVMDEWEGHPRWSQRVPHCDPILCAEVGYAEVDGLVG